MLGVCYDVISLEAMYRCIQMEPLCNETTPAIELYRCHKVAESVIKNARKVLENCFRNIFKREIRKR